MMADAYLNKKTIFVLSILSKEASMGLTIALSIICIFLIVILTGVEYAYLASNKLTIELKRKQGKASGKILGTFFDNPEKFWSTTTIGFYITLVCFCL